MHRFRAKFLDSIKRDALVIHQGDFYIMSFAIANRFIIVFTVARPCIPSGTMFTQVRLWWKFLHSGDKKGVRHLIPH